MFILINIKIQKHLTKHAHAFSSIFIIIVGKKILSLVKCQCGYFLRTCIP